MAAVSIALLYVGRRSRSACGCPSDQWLTMTGADPGRPDPVRRARASCSATCSRVDSIGPALGGITALFAFLGGTWFPITGSGFARRRSPSALPSYWLVQAGHVGIGGERLGRRGGGSCVAAWTVATGRRRGLGVPPRHPAGLTGDTD